MEETEILDYYQDIEKGKSGETIYINYLINKGINYIDVRKEIDYMMLDVDFIVNDLWIDVKSNYKDDNCIILETYFNAEPKYGTIKTGWVYNSLADEFVFISEKTGTIIKLDNNQRFQNWLKDNINTYHLSRNKITYDKGRNRQWQGGFIRIPLNDIPKEFWK